MDDKTFRYGLNFNFIWSKLKTRNARIVINFALVNSFWLLTHFIYHIIGRNYLSKKSLIFPESSKSELEKVCFSIWLRCLWIKKGTFLKWLIIQAQKWAWWKTRLKMLFSLKTTSETDNAVKILMTDMRLNTKKNWPKLKSL